MSWHNKAVDCHCQLHCFLHKQIVPARASQVPLTMTSRPLVCSNCNEHFILAVSIRSSV